MSKTMNRLLYTFSIKRVNLIVAPSVCKLQPRSQGSLLPVPTEREREPGNEVVLDSGLHAMDSWFQVLDSSLCQWNLDSGLVQSLKWFRIPWAIFRTPKPRIPDSTSKNFPNSGIPILLHEATFTINKFLHFSQFKNSSRWRDRTRLWRK